MVPLGYFSLGSSLAIFSMFFPVFWSISTEINNGLPMPLMCYLFIILFFRILAYENIDKTIDD